MVHLYELSTQYSLLTDLLESGEATQESVESLLKEITTQINDKAESIGKLILSLESDTNVIIGEINRLTQRKTTKLNRIEWLKTYLLQELTCANLDKVKTPVVSVSIRTNPPSINVVNPNIVPQEYRRIIPETFEIDKKKILDAIKDTGEIIAGIEVIKDKKRLEVK